MKENYETEPSKSLFHFTSLEIALEKILPTFKLRLGLFENTNDPRENKSFGFGAFNGEFKSGQEIEDHQKWDEKITKLLRNKTKVICFSKDYNFDNEWFDGYNLPRMWAQYGDNHKGVCLDIDTDILKQENPEIMEQSYLKPIIYDSKFEYPWIDYDRIRQLGLDNYVNEFKESNHEYLFFSKFIDWQSEREVRLVYFSDSANDQFVSIRNCLKRIILGVDFNNVYLPSIISLAKGITIEKIFSEVGQLKSFEYRKEYVEKIMRIDNKG